jgi:hypothetical protein
MSSMFRRFCGAAGIFLVSPTFFFGTIYFEKMRKG